MERLFLIGLAASFRSGAIVMFDKADIQSYREANLTTKKERYSIA
ncbi:hypothetical protein [Ligilactobacillus salitolerans]|nr:hypothetical protein [Ligilactobacillus salitolerans]